MIKSLEGEDKMNLKQTQVVNGQEVPAGNYKIAGGIDASKIKNLPDFKKPKYQRKATVKTNSSNYTRQEIYSRRHKLGNIVYPER